MKRKTTLLAGLLIITLVALLGGFILIKPQYSCEISPGPHYCHLDSSKPRLIERTASSFPEDFQVRLGGTILTIRQDLISKEENDKAIELSMQIYNEMSSKQEWSTLPSSLGISYEKILKINFEQSQYFLYIPQDKPERAIVFLHGFGGNFNSYLYVLSQIAEDTNSVLIAPSYRNGVWDTNSIGFIDNVITEVVLKTNLNNADLSLVGFSNGGLIIPEYLLNSKHQFSNIIGLSTYMDSSKYNNLLLIDKLRESNLTYIYGTTDGRLGLEDSLKSLDHLREKEVFVRVVGIEGDHLILFKVRDKVLDTIKSAIL